MQIQDHISPTLAELRCRRRSLHHRHHPSSCHQCHFLYVLNFQYISCQLWILTILLVVSTWFWCLQNNLIQESPSYITKNILKWDRLQSVPNIQYLPWPWHRSTMQKKPPGQTESNSRAFSVYPAAMDAPVEMTGASIAVGWTCNHMNHKKRCDSPLDLLWILQILYLFYCLI